MHRKSDDFLSANLFYFIACYFLVIISVVVTFIGIDTSSFSKDYAVQMIVIEVLAIGVPPIFFIFFPYWKNFLKNTRMGRVNPTIFLIIPVGIVGYLFISYLSALWVTLLQMIGLTPEAAAASVPTPETPALFGWSLLAIALTPAVTEEFLFRGLIMPAYERRFRRPITAILLSGVVFALMHGQFLAMPAHIILGIVLGFIVVATESFWAGVLLHFIQNALSMTILYFQDKLLGLLEGLPGHEAAVVGNAVGAAFGSAGSSAMDAAEPFALFIFALLAVLFGAVYFGLLFLLYYLYKRRNGKSPFAPREEGIIQTAETELTAYPPMRPKGGFLGWLPLLLTAPLILFEYAGTFLMMVPGFTEWLWRLSRIGGN